MTRNRTWVAFTILVLLTSSACSPPSSSTPASCEVDAPLTQVVDATELARTAHPYMGDASKNMATDGALQYEAFGSLTTKDMDSTSLTRHVEITPAQDCSEADAHKLDRAMRDRAVLTMATIDNLAEVTWTFTDPHFSPGKLDRVDAQKAAGTAFHPQPTADTLRRMMEHLDQQPRPS